MLRYARTPYFLVVLFVANIVVAQTEFSAEIADLQKPGASAAHKIYFGNYKTRIETRGESAVIVNLIAGISTILTAEQHTYFQGSTEHFGAGTNQIYALLRPDDVENACADWLKIKFMRSETCQKTGHETLNGRRTVKYEGKCFGEICHIWLDRDLHVTVKSETKLSSSELRDIREGPQPAALFEVPAGYTQTLTISGVISKEPH